MAKKVELFLRKLEQCSTRVDYRPSTPESHILYKVRGRLQIHWGAAQCYQAQSLLLLRSCLSRSC